MRCLSILVASYQAERWLADCIESILEQELPAAWEIEVLIGVDGCEATLRQAERLNNKFCKVVSLSRNYGTYVTFNTLMQYAKGELISRFDADDIMLPGFLKRQIQALQAGADMTHTWSIYTDEDLQPTSHVMAHTYYHPEGGLNRKASDGQFMIRRKLWQKLGGFRPWKCGADTEFHKRARQVGARIDLIEEFLYYRRTHPNSLTAAPATNFESPLRLRLQAEAERLVEEYRSGRLPLKIEAVTGNVDSVSHG